MYIASRAKGWGSSKDIGRPAKLTLGLHTKPKHVSHTSNHLPPRDHNQVLLWRFSAFCLPILLTLLFAASILSLRKQRLRSNYDIRLTSDSLPGILLSSLDNFVD